MAASSQGQPTRTRSGCNGVRMRGACARGIREKPEQRARGFKRGILRSSKTVPRGAPRQASPQSAGAREEPSTFA
eukprot:3756611-Alexandrium_andersonii.AAC.1